MTLFIKLFHVNSESNHFQTALLLHMPSVLIEISGEVQVELVVCGELFINRNC